MEFGRADPVHAAAWVQKFLDSVFFSPFPRHTWDSVFFFQNTEIGKFSLSLPVPDIFQDQGSVYSLRVSSGSLYGVSPVKILIVRDGAT